MNLLYPYGKENLCPISDDTYKNLAIDELVQMIAVTSEEQELVSKVLKTLPTDEETCIYRQEILRDLADSTEFCEELGEVLKKLDVLKEYKVHNHFITQKRACMWDLVDYMNEMDIYIQIVEDLNLLFDKYSMSSKGLIEIKELLSEVINMDRIAELKEIVEKLKAEVATLKSVTVGINLTQDLYPADIRVLDYSTEPIPSKYEKVAWGLSIAARRQIKYREPTPFMKYICEDTEKYLKRTVQNYKSELKEYINFKGYFLLDICNDLKFYLMVAKFGRKLRSLGYDICFPRFVSAGNSINIKGIYNIRLTAKKVNPIVKNDFDFSGREKVFILTGPNRGGKTMLTQAVGIAAFMAGQGLFVTADAYEGFLFDNILTHFPADENETLDLGRLGEEAVRIKKIASDADDKSLVLLNETYSSTSAIDGLYLAKDLVHLLKHKGIPTIFNTHLHDLARMTDEMNKWDGDSDVVSIIMEIVDNVNTYKVLRKEPDNSSYAHNIALKYGVTYEQMMEDG